MSQEQEITGRAPDGVSSHEASGGWHVVVARKGERVATWYHHVNDDPRLKAGQLRSAERIYASWEARHVAS